MKLRRFEVTSGDGSAEVHDVLSGPGHDVAIVAALQLDERGGLHAVFKAGDTRAPRVARGEPYVKVGAIGGRLDVSGEPPDRIAAHEVEEEVGGQVVEGTLFSLGAPVATMPVESTEADWCFAALVRFAEGHVPQGDGQGMELPGLLRAERRPIAEALAAIDAGEIGEAARARVAYTRALHYFGFIPELAAFVFQLPAPVRDRYDSLGLGEPVDPRGWSMKLTELPRPAEGAAARVNDVRLEVDSELQLPSLGVFRDARARHVARSADGHGQLVGNAYRIQYLAQPYDTAKVVLYAPDLREGAKVWLAPSFRPAWAAKRWAVVGEYPSGPEPAPVTQDALDVKASIAGEEGRAAIHAAVDRAVQSELQKMSVPAGRRLGASGDASPGQCELRQHFYAAEVAASEAKGWMPISDAIAACRGGAGDAALETALLRLASELDWIPTLRMRSSAARLGG